MSIPGHNSISMNFSLSRTVKYYALKFKRLRGDPPSLALGTAIGVLIGISPTIPLHTVAIIVVTLLMRASTIAALISASVISNPLTMAPLYYLCWLVGDFVLPDRLNWDRILMVLDYKDVSFSFRNRKARRRRQKLRLAVLAFFALAVFLGYRYLKAALAVAEILAFVRAVSTQKG